MSRLSATDHAITRMAQRGIRANDMDLMLLLGTEVEGGLVVLGRDVRAFEGVLRDLGTRARRLQGQRMVIADGRIVTAYHASRLDTRRLLRRV